MEIKTIYLLSKKLLQVSLSEENSLTEYFAGIDIGGTKTLLGITDQTGRVLCKRFDTPKTKIDAFLSLVRSNFEELLDEIGIELSQIVNVGVACPGLLDKEKGLVIRAINLDWSDIEIVKELKVAIGISHIQLEGDTRAALFAEYLARNMRIQNIAYLTVSTGIGLALMLDGKIWRGVNNFAGELGQTIVKGLDILPNSRLESFASGKALESSRGGEFESMEATKLIACAIYNLYQILDIDLLVIGGGLGAGNPVFFSRIENFLLDAAKSSQLGRRYPIERSIYGTQSSLLGALEIARLGRTGVTQ
jgi:predicted NBD/HSP70 family sugar kinase